MPGPVHLLHYADVENAFDKPERVGRLAGTIDALRDVATIVTGGGDNTAPGVLSLATRGKHARLLFDAIEPDVDTFGNHDFDHGFDAIRETIRESPQQWLTANLELDGKRFADADTVPRTTIRDTRSHRRPHRRLDARPCRHQPLGRTTGRHRPCGGRRTPRCRIRN